MIMMRVGQGFDVHRFTDDPARRMVLGGVEFPGERGLAGHSDADVVAHAVVDALLGAAGLGDIGDAYPDTEPAWHGADSSLFLRETLSRLNQGGWRVVNVGVVILAQEPNHFARHNRGALDDFHDLSTTIVASHRG